MNRQAVITTWAGYGILAFAAIGVALASMRFYSFDASVLTEELRRNLLDHPLTFYLHTSFAPLALLVGVFQFIPATRRSAYHRWAGRVYVIAALVASASAFAVAFTTEAGPLAATGFAILAVLWFGATVIAYLHVRGKRYVLHRRWMFRSYGLACAAITLRIILPVGMASGLTFFDSYTLAAWGSWIISLSIAELLLRLRATPTNLPTPIMRA